MSHKTNEMNFEDFRHDIESKFTGMVEYELQEYHFKPYSFGNGSLSYRIGGRIHKFIYDGREDMLTWLVGSEA